jgi:hypothetical protein
MWTKNSFSGRFLREGEISACCFGRVAKIRSVSSSFRLPHLVSCRPKGAALIAALIYRKRARKENDVSYEQSATEFENLAVQILDKFYQVNTYACTKALIRQIPAYGNVTWLQIAVAAEAKEFIAQRGVQDVLNNIW